MPMSMLRLLARGAGAVVAARGFSDDAPPAQSAKPAPPTAKPAPPPPRARANQPERSAAWFDDGRAARSLDAVGEAERGALSRPLSASAQETKVAVLKHQLPCRDLQRVLRAGSLSPASRTGRPRHLYADGAHKKTYLELTNDATEAERAGNWGDCTLYLSLKLLDDRSDYHVAQFWRYGVKHPQFTADATDVERRGNIMARLPHQGVIMQNEVVFAGDDVPLAANLRGAAGPPEHVDAVRSAHEAMRDAAKDRGAPRG